MFAVCSVCLSGRVFGSKSVAYLGLCGLRNRSGRGFCYGWLLGAEGVWSSIGCRTVTLSCSGKKRDVAMLYEGDVVDEVTGVAWNFFFPLAPVILRRARSLLLSEIHVLGK